MRLLLAVPSVSQGSGLGKYVISLSTILIEAGHEVAVITTHTVDHEYETRVLEKCGVRELAQFGHLSKLKKYLATLRYINKWRPDCIINNYDGLIQFLLPFLRHNPRIVHVIHNDTDDFYRLGAINGKHVDGWIAPTESVARRFNDYTSGKYAGRVSVIPHGVESAAPVAEDKNNLAELIFVGVHYEHKGVLVLPDIIRMLKSKGFDFHFTICGQGKLSGWLKDSLKEEIGDGTVTFAGLVTPEEIYRLQAKSDIFVYPTHIDSFGLVIAEAMMNATVPVVTLLEGITDNLIENKKDGFLLPQDDVDAFADTIGRLIKNPSLLHDMKTATRKKAESKFSLKAMSEAYLNYLTDVMLNPRRNG